MNTHDASAARRGRQGLGAWLALALLVGGLAAPLLLAAPAAARPRGQHCAAQAQEEHAGKAAARAPKAECYATFAEAVAAATGGQVRLGRNAKPGDLTDRVLAQGKERGVRPARASQTVIGILYDLTDFGNGGTAGASFIYWTTNPNVCRGGATMWVSNLAASNPWWNDRISSARTFQGCNARYYLHANFGGTSIAGGVANDYDIANFDGPPAIPGMSNNASSIRWFRP